ncbi:hypothetical protein TNIN_396071 [Trichonephila inaurata madagascariensis]|uniref:Uncharacterized protein n=1 Tax=Trichonephila inaurata madagascariensis TaxID=2747483 RepID=A0A8X6WX65_9ARAC|nr:hypothetical protein TNIN_396071 [Trichonephila inaurata madagascariensis]
MDIRKCWKASANSTVLQTLIGPLMSRGTIQVEKYRFSPAFYSLDGRFPTLQLSLWLFNLHNKASDGVEDVRGTFRDTLNPFTGRKRGVNLVRGRVVTLIPGVAYIKVAPVSGCVRLSEASFESLYFPK